MNGFRDREVIAKYKNSEIIVEFSKLFRFEGERLSIYSLEKKIAQFFFFLTFIFIVVPVVILILKGDFTIAKFINPDSFLHFMPYLAIPTFLYAQYLERDRDQFEDEIRNFDLQKIQKKVHEGEALHIILNRYFNFKIESILDKAFYKKDHKYIVSLVHILAQMPEVKYFWEKRLGINTEKFINNLARYDNNAEYSFGKIYRNLFIYLYDEAVKLGSSKIDEFILLFVLNKYYLREVFLDLGITDLELEGLRVWFENETRKKSYHDTWQKLSKLKPTGDVNRAYTSRATPVLDEFSSDFTKDAAKGNFMLSIGKESEMSQVLDVLQKDHDSAAIVLGEPGVGKTRFIRYLATKMVVEDVPGTLRDSRLVVVDLNKVLTLNSSVDSFKSNLQKMLEEVRYSGNVILVLEEFSQILNIREESRLEVVNLIANAIDNLQLRIIATTNYNNYVKYIKPIKILSALFQVVKLNEPSSNISLQILIDEVPRLESKYNKSIQLNALKRIVEFSPKFDFERVMPDKGIDLLEEACVSARSTGLKFIDANTVDQLLTQKIGVNVGSISSNESENLLRLADEMHKRVVGQDEAINAVSSAIKRSRSGLTSTKRPIASFMFFGPTGVGKTEVAKTLADVYYGDEKFMIRVDMSEYQEQENLNRLIGYTDEQGNFIGGFLTESVRAKPFSLVLLDEIEKANKKVLDLFLQVLDEGTLNDGMGRKVDFTNTIIIMTSNVGSSKIAELVLKGEKYHEVEKEVMTELRNFFRIEFLNRFDKLIMFKPLTKIEVEQVVEIMLRNIKKNLLLKGINVVWNDQTREELAVAGFSPMYGARELRRVLQEQVEDKLADLIIKGQLKSGQEAVFNGLVVNNIVN